MTRSWRRREDGSSAISSVFSVAIFLGFLLLSTQALVHLYATSTITAVAFDTARRASADGASCPPEAQVRARLGRYGSRIDPPTCLREPDGSTVVTIAGPSPAAAFGSFAATMGLGGADGAWRIERSAVFRTERGPEVTP